MFVFIKNTILICKYFKYIHLQTQLPNKMIWVTWMLLCSQAAQMVWWEAGQEGWRPRESRGGGRWQGQGWPWAWTWGRRRGGGRRGRRGRRRGRRGRGGGRRGRGINVFL